MHYFIASLTEKTTLASWFTKEHLNNSIINAYDLFYYKICIDSCSQKKKKRYVLTLSLSIYIYIYMAMKIERSVIVQRGFEYLTTIEIRFFFLQMELEERDTLLQQRPESSSQTEIQKL